MRSAMISSKPVFDSAATGGDAAAVVTYRGLVARRRMLIALAATAAFVAFGLDVCLGPSGLGLAAVLRGLIDPASMTRSASVVLFDLRLPAAVLAVLVGLSLSLAGAEMQTILNNPLASPFTLGLSSAATFGAALGIVLDVALPGLPATWNVPLCAFAMALLASGALFFLAHAKGAAGQTLLLFGIALFFTFNALVALLQFVASEQALQQLVFWTLGSLSRGSWDKIFLLICIFSATAPFSFAASWKLTALRLGEDRAASLGVDVEWLRWASFLRVSLLTAAAVSFVGTIGFIGLVAPHIARLLVGEDHRFFLPMSALCGSVVMSLAAIAAKMLVPGVVLPIGIVTALAGIPIFFSLILMRTNLR